MSFKENKWNICFIGDVADILNGYAFKAKDFQCKGVPIIKIKNIVPPNISIEDVQYVSRDLYNEKIKYALKYNDILISMTGSGINQISSAVGKIGRVRIKDESLLLNQRVGKLFVKDKNKCDEDYLYYYMTQNSIRYDLASSAGGSANQANISPAQIKSIKIILPPLEEQKAIAKILSDLDEKIEVNNKINKNLEEMAQAIFKQWFVDFEFPIEEGKPYKSSGGEMVKSELGMIPKGWKVFYMEEFVNTYNGYSYKGKELTKSNDAMITIKNFDRKGGYKLDGLKEISISNKVKEHHYIDINDIVIAHTDLTQGAEIIGNPIMVYSKGKYNKLIMSMDTVKVTSKKSNINNSLLYYIFKDFRFKSFALKFVNGTTVLHLSKTTIPKYKIALPNDENILLKIGGILNSLTNKISNNIIENERLEKLRDTLLPKLMSGEIRVCLENSEN